MTEWYQEREIFAVNDVVVQIGTSCEVLYTVFIFKHKSISESIIIADEKLVKRHDKN